jgi:hypothetical protein
LGNHVRDKAGLQAGYAISMRFFSHFCPEKRMDIARSISHAYFLA